MTSQKLLQALATTLVLMLGACSDATVVEGGTGSGGAGGSASACSDPEPNCGSGGLVATCVGGQWQCENTCPPDCIGGEFIVSAGSCTCRYYNCSPEAPACAGVFCFRDEWVCTDDGTCDPFDWGSFDCAAGLVCAAGAWTCP